MNDKKPVSTLSINLKVQVRYTIGLILFLMLAVWFVFVFIVSPKYQASTQLLIEETAPAIPHLSVESSRIDSQTIEAYAAFIKSPEVLEQVRKDLELHSSMSNLLQQVHVNSSSNSPVLTVTVSSDSSNQSVEIANTLAFVFQNKVRNSLKADSVNIISPATLEDSSQKNLVVSLVLTAFFGLIVSILMALGVNAAKAAASAKNRDIRKKENQLQTVFK